jgi:type II secretory pathway pseudopilin PulG
MRKILRSRLGFTIVELVIILVVLAIMAAIAIPRYNSVSSEAKESACKSALKNLRAGIYIYYTNRVIKGDSAHYPPCDSLMKVGCIFPNGVPKNPFQNDRYAPDSIIETDQPRGVTIGDVGGWAYNPDTGDIWPNTDVVGENMW